jgi:hypothetical protein
LKIGEKPDLILHKGLEFLLLVDEVYGSLLLGKRIRTRIDKHPACNKVSHFHYSSRMILLAGVMNTSFLEAFAREQFAKYSWGGDIRRPRSL